MSSIDDHFSFTLVQSSLDCLKPSASQELLLKWNVENPKNLLIQRYRFTGALSGHITDEYIELLKYFIQSGVGRAGLGISGVPIEPLSVDCEQLNTNVTSVDFFDKLQDYNITSASGSIRGCFEETFNGISASDTLREVLLNEESDNAGAFSEEAKKELIYHIFRILVIGGSMCQPEIEISKYLDVTRAIYKEALTAYKDSKTGDLKISGKVFRIKAIKGADLFDTDYPVNTAIVIIDPMKKFVTTIKNTYRPFW